MRRFTPIELAIGASLLGCIAAISVPTFARELHSSRLAEPIEGLNRLGFAALSLAEAGGRFPDSAPLTPSVPPRGVKVIDPGGTWDAPTWRMLDFRASPEDVPHAFSFGFEGSSGGFVGRAKGDLDGDGLYSTFEIRGSVVPGAKPRLEPGMYIESELE